MISGEIRELYVTINCKRVFNYVYAPEHRVDDAISLSIILTPDCECRISSLHEAMKMLTALSILKPEDSSI